MGITNSHTHTISSLIACCIVHLDGSLRMETLIELARKEGLSFGRSEVQEAFKDRYLNLEEYLKGFQYTVAVMQNAEV